MIIWEHTVPTALILLAVAGASALIGFSFWWFVKRDIPAIILFAVRLAFIGLLTWCLFMPTQKESTKHLLRPRFIVAVDTSQSMLLAPPQETVNRWSMAKQAMQQSWTEAVGAECDIDVYPFSTEVGGRSTLAAVSALAPDGKATLLRDALKKLSERYRGQNITGFLLLSDGVDTREAYDDWANEAWPWPVFTTRPEPPATWEEEADLRVDTVTTPRRVNVGWNTEMKAVISGQGTKGAPVTVQLLENGSVRQELPTQIASGGGAKQVSFQLEHPEVGNFTYTVSVPPLAGESHTNDNTYSVTIQVIDNKNRLLYVEGPPRWESKFLTRALKANPKVTALSFIRGPNGQFLTVGQRGNMTADMMEAQLAFFKIVIVGNLDATELGEHRAQNLLKFVEMGGSLVLLGGPKAWGPSGFSKSPLAKLLPIKSHGETPIEGTFPVRLTDSGKSHPAFAGDNTLWDIIPPILSVYPDTTLSAGAESLVVANTPEAMQSVIVAQRYGQGKVVVVLTDSLWRWKLSPEAEKSKPYQRFWDQLLAWLSPAEKELQGDQLDLFTDKEQLFLGEETELSAVLNGKDQGKGELAVTCEITTPENRKMPLLMAKQNVVTPTGKSFPGYSTKFVAQVAGLYQAVGVVDRDGKKVESDPVSFFVKPFTPESVPRPAKTNILDSISKSSGGKYFDDLKELNEALSNLKFAGREEESVKYRSLWETFLIISCLMTLLSIEWAIRKWRNMP